MIAIVQVTDSALHDDVADLHGKSDAPIPYRIRFATIVG